MLGRLDQRRIWARFRKTETGVRAALESGLFALEEELSFDVLERFESTETLVEKMAEWEETRFSPELAERLRVARPPVDFRGRVRLRRFRRLRA